MLVEMLKKSLLNGTKESSKIYFCGNHEIYKIGQTAQRYVSQRMQTIRKVDKGITLYAYVEFEGSKALRDFIESTLRLYMQGLGYQLQGNDHFVKHGDIETFKSEMLTITTATLNELGIEYKVINKK